MTTRSRLAHLAPVTVAVLALVGCGSSSKSSATQTTFAASAATTAAAAAKASTEALPGGFSSDQAASAVGVSSTAAAAATTAAPPAGVATGGVAAPQGVDRKVIVTVNLDVQVTDVSSSSVKATSLAEGVGGEVFSQQTNLVAEHPTSTIVFKVPPGKVNTLLTSLGELGKVQSQTSQAEDVTAQFVDIESRITSAERSVLRAREFLDKAGTVGELASLESELSRRESDRDSLLGQKRVLESRTSLATITLTLTPTPKAAEVAKVEKPKKATVGRALHNGVRTVSDFGKALAIVLAFLLPWIPVLALFGALLWVFGRRAARASAARRAALVPARPMSPGAYIVPQTVPASAPAAAPASEPVPVGAASGVSTPERA